MARVDILMTIYDAGPYLAPAIDSLLAQDFTDWRLIAVENGSRDSSKAVLASYADPRILAIDLPANIGRTPALQRALEAADAEYVAVLDADDLSRPERLGRQVAVLDANPDIVLVGSSWQDLMPDGTLVDAPPLPLEHEAIIDALAAGNPIAHSSVMYRRAAAMRVGGYPADLVFAQDLGLYHRLAAVGRLAILPEALVAIRIHGGQVTNRPDHALIRLTETERLVAAGMALPGVSPPARSAGRRALASLRAQRGIALWRSGRPAAAMAAWAAAVASAPLACGCHALRRLTGATP